MRLNIKKFKKNLKNISNKRQMKKKLSVLLLLLVTFSCSEQNGSKYLITGNWSNADGEVVYLGINNTETKKLDAIDSAIVVDGGFKLSGNLDEFIERTIFTKYGKKIILINDEPFSVDITLKETKTKKGKAITRAVFKIYGSKEQELYTSYMSALTTGMMGMFSMMKVPEAQKTGDTAMLENIKKIYLNSQETEKRIIDSLFLNFKDNYISAIILDRTYSKKKNYTELEEDYASLSEKVKSSPIGVKVRGVLDEIKRVAIGQPAPAIEAETPNGEIITLESLKGKYVLIDFWASWCGPCIKEVPNVKKIYDKFKDKGFEILAISLDDDKDKWIKGIAKHDLNWLHASTLKGWKCNIGKEYNVTGVPRMYLLNDKGEILFDNIKGHQLEEELNKIFNK